MIKRLSKILPQTLGLVLALSCGALTSKPVMAALDGELDTTSTGYLQILVGISNSFKISRLDDISLTISNRDEDVVIREPICIRGIGSTRYTFTASVANTNEFELVNEQGETLPFALLFYPNLDFNNFDELTPNTVDKEYEVLTAEPDCGGEDSSAIEVVFQSPDLKKASSTVFTGVLVLTVGSL